MSTRRFVSTIATFATFLAFTGSLWAQTNDASAAAPSPQPLDAAVPAQPDPGSPSPKDPGAPKPSAPDPTAAPAAAKAAGTTGASAGAGQPRGKDQCKPSWDDCYGYMDGSCRTPRHAWCQLLGCLQQDGAWKVHEASACIDHSWTSKGEDPSEYAGKLKRVLDKEPTIVTIQEVPDNPDYRNADDQNIYEDKTVAKDYAGITLVRKRDNRWVFSKKALLKGKRLYEDTAAGFLEKYMPPFLQERLLGVEGWKYLAVLLLIFIAFTLQKLVVFIIGTYVRRLVGKSHRLVKQAVNRAGRPIGGLAMALVFYIGFPMLVFPVRVSQLAMIATEALAAYSVVWLGYRLIDVLADFLAGKAERTESKLDDQLVPLVTKTLKVFVSVIGGIFILQNLHVNVGSLLAGLGLGGLAFALAARDTIANFFGSIMIFVDKPFQIGDWVEINDTEGVVEEVGFRTTRVRTFYNSLVTVPNASIVNAAVDNYGVRRFRRYTTTLGLCYDTPPAKVQAFCEGVRAIIAGMPGMRKDYYLVEFKDFGASALEIMVYCFMVSPTWNAELRTRTNLNLEIMRLAESLGVAFAFPTQTLHLETLARSGEARPSHSGPTTPEELATVVNGFGPGGELARPVRKVMADDYDCGRRWVEAGDGGGEG